MNHSGTVRHSTVKLKELLSDLIKRQVFGKPLAYVYTIEFQKRGLPHAHILLILADEDKPRDPSQYDTIVSAEIPDRLDNPRLYNIVKRCMIHGPCGLAKKIAPCMRDGNCSKKYTKEFSSITTTANDGYPIYRRMDNNRSVEVGGCLLDNRWVVPYNPFLLLKYNAHINVEICTTVSAVKYLYKYVYKGHDKAIVEFRSVDNADNSGPKRKDEVANYLEARYISATVSCDRIFAYELHANMPHVMRLALHLENQQSVVFSATADLEDILSKQKHTTLTGWFVANSKFPSARAITYTNFPDQFVWAKSKRAWKERVKGHVEMIGRVYSAHPGEGERFFLRMLLNHVTGCKSYEDIRTLPDGTVCNSYKEAALERGLLDDDQEIDECLSEGATRSMPVQLRELFVTILLFIEPAIPFDLWDKYKASFAEDFLHRTRTVLPEVELDEHILNSVLLDLEYRLSKYGKSLSDFPGMPIPVNVSNPYEESRVILDELSYSVNEQNDIMNHNLPLLNTDQLRIYNIVIEAVYDYLL